MKSFTSFLPQTVMFGPDTVKSLPRVLGELSAGSSILVMADQGVTRAGITDIVVSLCAECGPVHQYVDVPPEPTEHDVTTVVSQVGHADVDVIVAVGGGSVMDMAKFVALMIHGGPTMDELFAGASPSSRSARLVMIPTTAGTGSEATPNAIALRPSQNLKVGVVCPAFIPDAVLLDPHLLLALPPHITAATGMDALCHALECYTSNKANPLSDMFAMESMRLIFANLETCVNHGDNVEARGSMLLAAFYAGVCIACSGTTAVHALSYPLGGRYRIPHGVSNAILLAPVLACNKSACVDRLARVARLINPAATGEATVMADVVVAELARLARAVGIPATLQDLGVPAGDLEELVEAASQVTRLLNNNPKPLTREDIRAVYQSLLA